MSSPAALLEEAGSPEELAARTEVLADGLRRRAGNLSGDRAGLRTLPPTTILSPRGS